MDIPMYDKTMTISLDDLFNSGSTDEFPPDDDIEVCSFNFQVLNSWNLVSCFLYVTKKFKSQAYFSANRLGRRNS